MSKSGKVLFGKQFWNMLYLINKKIFIFSDLSIMHNYLPPQWFVHKTPWNYYDESWSHWGGLIGLFHDWRQNRESFIHSVTPANTALTTLTYGFVIESAFWVHDCYSTSIRKCKKNIVSQINPQYKFRPHSSLFRLLFMTGELKSLIAERLLGHTDTFNSVL